MLTNLYVKAISKFQTFRREERGAVDVVAIVVMIGIAVALAVIFRTQIETLITNLLSSIESNATTAVG